MAKHGTKSANLDDILPVLRGIAPEHLAEPWDKVGLHIGNPSQRVSKGLLCIDLTEAVMAEAVKLKAELVVAYHPVLFEPVARLTGSDWKQRVVAGAVRRGVAVYCPHTALDAARGGINDWLCDGLGEAEVTFAITDHVAKHDRYKVVVFVPGDEADAVRTAMLMEGAGDIGDYSGCSYNGQGFGTFVAGAGSKPTIGKVGRFERVSELRLEMVCDGRDVGSVVRAAKAAHSYEEPAVDVYKLADDIPAQDEAAGAGRIVELSRPASVAAVVGRVRRRLGWGRGVVRAAEPAAGGAGQGVAGSNAVYFDRCASCSRAMQPRARSIRTVSSNGWVASRCSRSDGAPASK